MAEQAPFVRIFQQEVPAVATAGNDLVTPLLVAPEAGTLSLAEYSPVAAITGAATNTRQFNIQNRGQAGTGTTVMATIQMNAGVNAAADTPLVIPLSGTAANLVVAAGDVIAFQSLHVGTGIADPGGLVTVQISRSA